MTEITEERMEKAMQFLAETDVTFAEKKSDLAEREILRKRVRSKIFLVSEGSVAERQAKAETAFESIEMDDAYIMVLEQYEALKARRERAEIVIDIWRSLNANRRKV